MHRLLFEKTGRSVWISHLDLMRVFQRAFKRAGLPLKHTQGFNPRPSVSIALPLSVGVESRCELLDFEIDGVTASAQEIKEKLNSCLIEGVKILDVYERGRKIRDLALLHTEIILEYDLGVPAGAVEEITDLFNSQEVIVPKKTKSGIQDQNIIPMIKSFEAIELDDNTIKIDALICCQNPALNPAQIPLAVEMYLPALKADNYVCSRLEVYDLNENIFR